MTATINFKADQCCAAWTSAKAGEVSLHQSGRQSAQMTPDNARRLAADLVASADEAEALAGKAE